MDDVALKILSLCIALAGVETLHGIARAAILVPRMGKAKSLKVGIVTGSLLAFTVCYLLVPGIGLTGGSRLLGLGAILALFMACFDMALARFVLHLPWSRVLQDFDPRTGNYLTIGLVGLVLWPCIVMQVR